MYCISVGFGETRKALLKRGSTREEKGCRAQKGLYGSADFYKRLGQK